MSTNRAKAMEYSRQVLSNQTRIKKTGKPVYTTTKTRSGPPTYAQQNEERSFVDNIAAESASSRKEEKQIDNDGERDVIDKGDFTKGTKSGMNPTPTIVTGKKPTEETELKSAYSKCWTIVQDINFPLRTYHERSWYYPSSIMYFKVLDVMEQVLYRNKELEWISPNYFSLPVRVYYSVIFIVQILRAKQAAQAITKGESSWLRAFERSYRDTSCMIAGPLVPILSNLVYVQPDDEQYTSVYPSIPQRGLYSTVIGDTEARQQQLTVNSESLLLPNIPVLASILREFCTSQALVNGNFTADGSYVPFTLATGGDLAGINFPPHIQGAPNAHFARLLNNPALTHPIIEDRLRLNQIHAFWKRSTLKKIPNIPTNVAYDPSTPGEFTMLTDDFSWFEQCVQMATVNACFFTDATNLSQIPVTGDVSPLFTSRVNFGNQVTTPTVINEWYPDLFQDVNASFKSTVADAEVPNFWQAAYTMTNSTYEWQDANGNEIGTNQSQHRGGPYWLNDKITYELAHPTLVMSGIIPMIQGTFYVARPDPDI